MVRGFLGVQPRGIFWGSGANRTSKFYYGRKDDTAWNHDLVGTCVGGGRAGDVCTLNVSFFVSMSLPSPTLSVCLCLSVSLLARSTSPSLNVCD